MSRDVVPSTVQDDGYETHPAFGYIGVNRRSQTPGAVLFDSDMKHQHTVRIVIQTAERKRDLNHDWIHGRKQLIEVEMSEAQWASFVSSMNTSGVPCTIRGTVPDQNTPGLSYDPRLAHSMDEVRGAADKTFAKIKAALADYEKAIEEKAGAKVVRQKLHNLHWMVRNTEANLTFAAKSLTGHAENVVQRARADIEAMVGAEAARLGLEIGATKGLLELPAMPGEESVGAARDVG